MKSSGPGQIFTLKEESRPAKIDFGEFYNLIPFKAGAAVYERIHEEWMDDFQKEHNLPYPDPPEDDWYEKLKVEQRQLEEKWHLGKKSTS